MPACATGIILISPGPWFAEIAGVPLLHRLLLSGRKAGVRRWLVLAQHAAQWLHASLATAYKLRDVVWQVCDLAGAEAESLLASLAAEEVLVVAAPVVCDHRLFGDLQTAVAPALGVTTAGSTTPADVVVQDGLVVAGAGQGAPAYRMTGILRCSGVALGQILRQARPELRQGVASQRVILAGLMARTAVRAVNVSQRLWVPLVEPLDTSVAMAEAQLVRSLGREGDSILVRLLDRRLSQAITKRLMRTTVTPNQMTVCSAAVGLSGAFLLAQPDPIWQVLGSLLFWFSTVLDGCDGELARLTFRESEFGAKFDVVMDNVVHLFLFPSIALGLYRREYDTLYFVLGALSLSGILVAMAIYLPYLWRRQPVQSSLARIHEHLASRDFAYALPVLALLDSLEWFLWATTIGAYLFAAAWVFIAVRARRQDSRCSKHTSS